MRNTRVNGGINAQQVMLILPDGKAHGKISKFDAIRMARDEGLDLIEVSSGQVPVCKIADYGKMQYDKSKAEKHKNHAPALKEIQVGYNTDIHDVEIKIKKINEFLTKGHKVLFTMNVKGRERYVAGHAARDKFEAMVRDYFPNAKVNDIQENGRGFLISLNP